MKRGRNQAQGSSYQISLILERLKLCEISPVVRYIYVRIQKTETVKNGFANEMKITQQSLEFHDFV